MLATGSKRSTPAGSESGECTPVKQTAAMRWTVAAFEGIWVLQKLQVLYWCTRFDSLTRKHTKENEQYEF